MYRWRGVLVVGGFLVAAGVQAQGTKPAPTPGIVLPAITSVTPGSGDHGVLISIKGTALASASVVRLGTFPATIVSAAASEIVVEVGPTPAGEHVLEVVTTGPTLRAPQPFRITKAPIGSTDLKLAPAPVAFECGSPGKHARAGAPACIRAYWASSGKPVPAGSTFGIACSLGGRTETVNVSAGAAANPAIVHVAHLGPFGLIAPGSPTVDCRIDPGNTVLEDGEANNTSRTPVVVDSYLNPAPYSDLVILAVGGPVKMEGGQRKVQVAVENRGNRSTFPGLGCVAATTTATPPMQLVNPLLPGFYSVYSAPLHAAMPNAYLDVRCLLSVNPGPDITPTDNVATGRAFAASPE